MVIGQIFKALSEETIAPKVLDLCAAPGGKSTLCLSGLEGRGLLVSNETIQSRVASLVQNIDKWGFSNVVVTSSDPEKFDALPNFFDVVLVDAPCSGEGLFRKDANSMAHWSKDLAHQCSLRQNRILQHAVQTLRPGGFLIYSTCTFNPEDNIVQIQNLCKQQFEPLPLESLESVGSKYLECFGYQGYPHLIQGEGLFVSVLKNHGGIQAYYIE
jgi:16S rRNA C967 or C1407 C5-methylase (RsmB/RsmF family)